MGLTLKVGPHPLLEIGAFATRFAHPLLELTTPPEIARMLEPGVAAPMTATDEVRNQVRQLLRHGGFKPAGRSKPASEYLVAAFAESRFPRINAAVDACNVASLWSGLPISLIDLDRISLRADRAQPPLSIDVCGAGTSYVFNPSGQVIDASGLLAVFDREGPTGTPVKDAQRTKTHDGTVYTLAIVWGTNALPGRTQQTTAWYRDLVAAIPGATNEDVTVVSASV